MDVEGLTIEEALQEEKTEAPVKVSVREEIERGKRLYDERLKRNQSQQKDVKPLYLSNKNNNKQRYFIWKLGISMQPKRKCDAKNHINRFVVDRDMLTRSEHVDYLAQPKKMETYVPKVKYWYKKAFPISCTPRIVELSLPKRKRVLETLNSVGYVLPPQKLENLTNLLLANNFCSIRDAANVYRTEKTCNRLIKKRKLRQAKKLKKKIETLEREQIEGVLTLLTEVMKDYLLEQHKYFLPESTQSMAEVILGKLSVISGFSWRHGNKDDPLQEFLRDLSDNLAVWIEMLVQNCGYAAPSVPKEDLTRACPHETSRTHVPSEEYLIEDYIEYEPSEEELPINKEFEEFEGEVEDNEEEKAAEGSERSVPTNKNDAGDEEAKRLSVDAAQEKTTE